MRHAVDAETASTAWESAADDGDATLDRGIFRKWASKFGAHDSDVESTLDELTAVCSMFPDRVALKRNHFGRLAVAVAFSTRSLI